MRTRYSVYIVLFCLIIFGWGLGIVALVFYVQRSSDTKSAHADNIVQFSPTPTVLTPTVFLTPTDFDAGGEYQQNSQFGKLLTPTL
jgi:hypothetical protein